MLKSFRRAAHRLATRPVAAAAAAKQPDASCDATSLSNGRRRRDAGFTLIELLVVIAILGLLIGLVAPAVLRQLGGAKTAIAKQSIERIGQILDLYKLDVGSYPTTEDGLQALVSKPSDAENWNGPYVKNDQLPLDPWNHPFIYRNPSDRTGHDYDLCSAGAGGSGGDASTQLCNR